MMTFRYRPPLECFFPLTRLKQYFTKIASNISQVVSVINLLSIFTEINELYKARCDPYTIDLSEQNGVSERSELTPF